MCNLSILRQQKQEQEQKQDIGQRQTQAHVDDVDREKRAKIKSILI